MSTLQREELEKTLSDLNSSQIKTLETWTHLTIKKILFDTEKDSWSANNCPLNSRILYKNRLLFLIENEDGQMYGYYLNTTIPEKYEQIIETDEKSFHFNLNANNRLPFPMKFEIRDTVWGGISLQHEKSESLIFLGDLVLMKSEKKNQSYCWESHDLFNYHITGHPLCGKVRDKFTVKRVRVFQMG